MIVQETEEVADVRSVAADFFNRQRVSLDDDGGPRFDRGDWRRACVDLGIPAIVEPEEFGGLDGGAAMLAAVLIEAGRTLSPLPLLMSAVLVPAALRVAAEPALRGELLERLLAGDVVASLISWEHADAVQAEEGPGGWHVTATVGGVLDAPDADLVLLFARLGDELALFVVETAAEGVGIEEQAALDLTRRFGRVSLNAAAARRLGSASAEAMGDLAAWRTFALACDQVGGSRACLESTLEYLRTRVQFGRVLGSFQSLKHQCADLAMVLDEATSALEHLVWALDHSSDGVPLAAAMAAATCPPAFVTCAEEMVHLHGGIGFTWEHDAHRYVRRALTNRSAFTNPATAREDLLAASGL